MTTEIVRQDLEKRIKSFVFKNYEGMPEREKLTSMIELNTLISLYDEYFPNSHKYDEVSKGLREDISLILDNSRIL